MLVCTMPGKIGDLLASMAVVRELSKWHGGALIVTSAYCDPVATFLIRLPYVRGVRVLGEDEYRIAHTHHGAQPWEMPVPVEFSDGDVYHLGFRHFPEIDQTIVELAAEPSGTDVPAGPWLPRVRVEDDGPLAVSAAAVTEEESQTLHDIVSLAKLRHEHVINGCDVRLIGTKAEIDRQITWIDPDEVAKVSDFAGIHDALDGCSRFVGINSGPSILAQGCGVPVVWPHRPGVHQERWAHYGCDVRTIDPRTGHVRVLRQP
jgi:hypothetical protein